MPILKSGDLNCKDFFELYTIKNPSNSQNI